MKVRELILEDTNGKLDLMDMLEKFLPFVANYLKIDSFPKIELTGKVDDKKQPTFGQYKNNENIIHLAVLNRHPMDIIRTLAHELVHYKQDMEGQLGPHSGETGSPQENQAHKVAGIILRHFGKEHPEFYSIDNVSVPQPK